MIYITGDTHGNIDFSKLKRYFSKRYVTRKDYLIILGDAGIVWSKKDFYINDYYLLGLTVLFVDGNHENFELLNLFPVVEYNGAKCHLLYSDVYHILRGEIINLNGLSFFCMGGATSIDKSYRINRISWWEEENISNSDILNGLNNLDKVNYHVDYVLSHCAPSFVVKKMFNYQKDSNTEILEKFQSQIDFKYWYFGHYHENKRWNNYRCFYGDILEIKKTNATKDIKYKTLVFRNGNLHNTITNRKVNIKKEDLPEWYYESCGWFHSLKDVTDVSFRRCLTNNHLDKDASVYLHYHGKLKKNKLYEPLNQEEWDEHIWRGYSKEICLGLEKYSPHLDLKKLKAAINLNYDHYNQRSELIWFKKSGDVVVRPFPKIETPHYSDKYSGEKAKYSVVHGDVILSDFLELENAINYAELYIQSKFGIEQVSELALDNAFDALRAYKVGHGLAQWILIKEIKYDGN